MFYANYLELPTITIYIHTRICVYTNTRKAILGKNYIAKHKNRQPFLFTLSNTGIHEKKEEKRKQKKCNKIMYIFIYPLSIPTCI